MIGQEEQKLVGRDTCLIDLPNEIWKPIPNYEDRYMVSNIGRVKAIFRVVPYNKDKKRTSYRSERVMKQKTRSEYCVISLLKEKKRAWPPVHRLVLIAFVGMVEGKNQVNHKNGNKYDNRLENLEWCNGKENIQHAIRTGLKPDIAGEKHFKAQLTENDVLRIRSLRNIVIYKDLAKEYNVGFSCIDKIMGRRTWKNI